MTRVVVAAVLSPLILAVVAVGQTRTDGEIAGRITDAQGLALPGVQVIVTSGDDRTETATNIEGRFLVRSLPLGPHQVDVRLDGFKPASGILTLSSQVPRAHVRWLLEIACLSDDSFFPLVAVPLREYLRSAESIVLGRVDADNGLVLVSARPGCDGTVAREYRLQVLRGVPGQTPAEATVWVHVHRQVRLDPGAEYIAIFWGGADLMLPVVSGRIAFPVDEVLDGMRVEDALEQLRRWSQEGRQRK